MVNIKAHATGQSLQRICRNLVLTPPSDGATYDGAHGC